MPEQPVTATLVDLLYDRASAIGDKQAFRFLRDHGGQEISLTYRELHGRAMAIGAELQASVPRGERALLLYPPGLDFITAFFGCLYAGVVAVPLALPARNRSTSSVGAIAQASNPAVVLSTANHCQQANRYYTTLPELLERRWIATDDVADDRQDAWRDPGVDGRQTAFLQYTSGSTSVPKVVVLTHDNLMRNAALIYEAFGNSPESRGVFWLPLYHDMGLIGGVVQPVYCGGSCTLMSPATFLQRPALWLETISQTQATVSGGPDFAYDLCVRKIRPEERYRLDLSNWKVAFTGAERIRAETIERFADAFACSGFRREAFFPCYGLAEATLMMSGGPRQTLPSIVHVRADALGCNQDKEATPNDPATRTLVGSGQCLSKQKIVIVDPQTRQQCEEGSVGEIWGQGPSVASGYFGQPEATQMAFGGRLATGEGPFLRTGDLGFLRGGQLFVTGRLKDVIIVRGRNYYPEDLERSVDSAHPAFRVGHCAAFSIDTGDRERLVIVQEIEPRQRDVDAEAAFQAIRRVIATQHELEIHAVVLAKAGEIPKTSSGKTRRSACRDRYLQNRLKVLAQWEANGEVVEHVSLDAPGGACQRLATVDEIEGWLVERVAARLQLPQQQIRVTTPFLEFGMGSLDAVELAAELERWLGRRMSPTVIYNRPTISALARWLAAPPSAEDPSVKLYHAHLAHTDPNSDPDRLLEDVRNMTEEDMHEFILQEMAKQQASNQ